MRREALGVAPTVRGKRAGPSGVLVPEGRSIIAQRFIAARKDELIGVESRRDD